jgi:hypothetical protein
MEKSLNEQLVRQLSLINYDACDVKSQTRPDKYLSGLIPTRI